MDVLFIGGTRFIGPRTVETFLAAGYDVSIFTRGESANPFADREAVEHVTGDRTSPDDLRRAREVVDPDVVVDLVGFHPADLREAVELFSDVGSYVFVSTVSAYAERPFPIVEDETPLLDCTDEQARDDSFETYGNRKAECDRIVIEAADTGMNATIIRPVQVYGPGDPSERLDYWIDRVLRRDRILVPGDGTNVAHQVFVDDVASAIRLIAEDGTRGRAYNCGARQATPLRETIDRIAAVAGTTVEQVFVSERELGEAVSFDAFPVYQRRPYAVDTDRLAALGWTGTDAEKAMASSIEDHRASDRDGQRHGPSDETESEILASLEA